MTSPFDDDSPTQPVPVMRPGSELIQHEAASGARNLLSVDETRSGQPGFAGLPKDDYALAQEQQNSAPTPRPLLRPGLAPARPRSATAFLALVIAAVSLALNLIVITKLLQARNQVDGVVSNAIARLESVCDPGTTPLSFPISQTIRFQGNIPMPQGLVIPFKGNIPFRTTMRVETFPGGPVVNVPINTVVPVDTQVPIPGNIVIPVDTSIPFRQDIPIDLCSEASPFHGLIDQLKNELRTLLDGF
jgi:hypothetical protein